MKFLELPNINAFNNFFGNLTTPDGSRLQIRLEVYTCKINDFIFKMILML